MTHRDDRLVAMVLAVTASVRFIAVTSQAGALSSPSASDIGSAVEWPSR